MRMDESKKYSRLTRWDTGMSSGSRSCCCCCFRSRERRSSYPSCFPRSEYFVCFHENLALSLGSQITWLLLLYEYPLLLGISPILRKCERQVLFLSFQILLSWSWAGEDGSAQSKGEDVVGGLFFLFSLLTQSGDGEREDEEGELKYKKKLSLSLSSSRHMVRDTDQGT